MEGNEQDLKRKRSLSPPARSPPRKFKRPGGAARVPQNSVYKERESPRDRLPQNTDEDLKRNRSPTPPPRSPPRQLKRPGGAARVQNHAALKERQQAREEEQRKAAQAEAAARGVHHVVKEHYNAVPQRGREFRKTDSLIKGLRSFNNWVKSCLIQKFSPNENFTPGAREHGYHDRDQGLLVLDIGVGKGGDLGKWQSAPQRVDLYVGVDPADVSIGQARDRYSEMRHKQNRNFRQRGHPLFEGHFFVKDGYGEWLGDIPIIQQVGIDGNVGPDAGGYAQRFGGGGFDVVTMMFCMHYAYESEAKARGMLKNVAGSLKKGGRFIGVIPNSDVLSAKAKEFNARKREAVPDATENNWDPEKPVSTKIDGVAEKPGEVGADDSDDDWDPEKPAESKASESVSKAGPAEEDGQDEWDPEKPAETKSNGTADPNSEEASKLVPRKEDQDEETLEWGNKIYRVKFPGKVPQDGVFRPPYGWKYFYFLEEAVETVPEYVVPWEAFRAMAVDYDLELQYRKPFNEVWDTEKNDPILGPLSERMNVREPNRGPLRMSDEEFEAASFYHAFCFYKV